MVEARLEAPERCVAGGACRVTLRYRAEGEYCQFINAYLYVNGRYDSVVRWVSGPGSKLWRIALMPSMPGEFDLQAYVAGEMELLEGPVYVGEVSVRPPIEWGKRVITCFWRGEPRPGGTVEAVVQILYPNTSLALRPVFDGYVLDINRCPDVWSRHTFRFSIPAGIGPGRHYVAVDALFFDRPIGERVVFDRCKLEFTV